MSEVKKAARTCKRIVDTKRAVDRLLDDLLEVENDPSLGVLASQLIEAQGVLAQAHQTSIRLRLYYSSLLQEEYDTDR